jgi:hypothetical protein
MSTHETPPMTAPTPSGGDAIANDMLFLVQLADASDACSVGIYADRRTAPRLRAIAAALLAARRERDALRDALRDVVDAYDWWQVDPVDREAPAEAIQAARAALAATPEGP